MSKPIPTDVHVDDIRFNRLPHKKRPYVKPSEQMWLRLNKYNRELEDMYDTYTNKNRIDKPELRKEALLYLTSHNLAYEGSVGAYVVNPWLSSSVQPTIHRIIRRAQHEGGQSN